MPSKGDGIAMINVRLKGRVPTEIGLLFLVKVLKLILILISSAFAVWALAISKLIAQMSLSVTSVRQKAIWRWIANPNQKS
jgi:hypothetical protein